MTEDSWTITPSNSEFGGVFIKDKNSSRYLTLYATSPNFRVYTSTTTQGIRSACIELIDVTPSSSPESDANTYATSFLSATDNCKSNAASVWDSQKSAFNALSN